MLWLVLCKWLFVYCLVNVLWHIQLLQSFRLRYVPIPIPIGHFQYTEWLPFEMDPKQTNILWLVDQLPVTMECTVVLNKLIEHCFNFSFKIELNLVNFYLDKQQLRVYMNPATRWHELIYVIRFLLVEYHPKLIQSPLYRHLFVVSFVYPHYPSLLCHYLGAFYSILIVYFWKVSELIGAIFVTRFHVNLLILVHRFIIDNNWIRWFRLIETNWLIKTTKQFINISHVYVKLSMEFAWNLCFFRN